MIKFICSKCESEIKQFQVLSKITHATTYVTKNWHMNWMSNREIVRVDREYLDGKVKEVIFECPACGGIKVTVRKCQDIKEFIRDMPEGKAFKEKDLTKDNYGPIKLIREGDLNE